MRLEVIERAINDINDFYNDKRLSDENVNTYVKIWGLGRHLLSSYYITLKIEGKRLIVKRGSVVNDIHKVDHQPNNKWERRLRIDDISEISIKFVYGDKHVEKSYMD